MHKKPPNNITIFNNTFTTTKEEIGFVLFKHIKQANKLANIASEMSSATKKNDIFTVEKTVKDFSSQFDFFIIETQKWQHRIEVSDD